MAVVPIGGKFTNMRAMLARIMEDEDAMQFAGVVYRRNGDAIPVVFDVSRERLAYTALLLGGIALEADDE